MIEAVLFDYGNVLSASADPVEWARMLQITGLDHPQFTSAYWAPRHAYDRGTHTGPEYWLAVSQHAGIDLSPSQVEALIAADTALWTRSNQPMIDWAARLQTAGTRTGILSNLGDCMTSGVLGKMPWLQHFHHRTFSHTVKVAKPELAIYRHAAEGLETSPENILFVDDLPANCDAGIAAGMQVIQYGDHASFVSEMERRGWGELWFNGRLPPKTSAR